MSAQSILKNKKTQLNNSKPSEPSNFLPAPDNNNTNYLAPIPALR